MAGEMLQPASASDVPGADNNPAGSVGMYANAQMPQMPQYNSAPVGVMAPPPDPELQAAAVHHGRLASMLNSVGDILGGNKTLRLMQNEDGSVDVKQVDSTAGEKWGRVAQAALSGAAKGFEVGQGPGGAARAAAASVQQGMAQSQAQQDKTLARAEQYNDQNRKKQLFNANMAMMDQQLISAKNANQWGGVRFGQEQQDFAIKTAKSISGMGGVMAGHFKDNEDMAAHFNASQAMQDAHMGKNGLTMPITVYNPDGSIKGVDAYIIPEDKRNQLNTERVSIPRWTLDPNNTGKLISDPLVIEPGMMTNEQILGALKGSHVEMNNATSTAWESQQKKDTLKVQQDLLPSEIDKNRASAASSYADARYKDEQTRLAPEAIEAKKQGNAATSRYVDTKYVAPARETEKAWQLADNTYQQYKALAAKGKTFPTGAESMQMLSRHLQTTFGQVKGARITKDMIQEHLGARSVSDKMQVAIQKAFDGDALSKDQWEAFHQLIGENRQATWNQAIAGAAGMGVDPSTFLPPDLGGKALPITLPSTPGAMPAPNVPATAQPARAPGTPAPGDWGNLPKAN